MKRIYKLAANYNTVEFELTEDDLLETVDIDTEVHYTDHDSPVFHISNDEMIKRVLQREYDILASIKVVNEAPAPKVKTTTQPEKEEADPPTKKQCEWARALGMTNPERKTKQEVWKYIQSHKDCDCE